MTGTSGIPVADMLQYFEAVHLRHLDVADDQVVITGTEFGNRLDRSGEAFDLVALVPENRFHHAAETFFVVNQHDALGRH